MIINLCWTDFCVLIFSIQFPSTRGRNRFTGARLNIAILFFADDLLAVLPFSPLSALVLVKKTVPLSKEDHPSSFPPFQNAAHLFIPLYISHFFGIFLPDVADC